MKAVSCEHQRFAFEDIFSQQNSARGMNPISYENPRFNYGFSYETILKQQKKYWMGLNIGSNEVILYKTSFLKTAKYDEYQSFG